MLPVPNTLRALQRQADLSVDEEEVEAEAEVEEKCKGALKERYRSIDRSSVCEAVVGFYFGT